MGKEWRVRTRFREVVLKVGKGSPAKAPGSAGALVVELFAELGGHNHEVERVLGEVEAELRGFDQPSVPSFATPHDVESVLASRAALIEEALADGELSIEEVEAPALSDLAADLPPVLPPPHVPAAAALVRPPAAPEPEPPVDTTFVLIKVRYESGRRAAGRHFCIKLPDGEVREGYTGADGSALVDGIVARGLATIDFLDVDAKSITKEGL